MIPSDPSRHTDVTLATLSRLRRTVEAVLADLKPADDRFALLDFPDHDNVGDSAIYLGDISYFRSQGLRPAYAECKDRYDEALMTRTIGLDAPIFFHGGGNFGDVWPWFQQFRERVMARFPGRPIVQLPQTLYFGSQTALDATARAIEAHGAFTLLVRDQRSYDLATRAFNCDVRLCPDTAFCIKPIQRAAPKRELLFHLRRDHEAAAPYDVSHLTADARIVRADWSLEPPGFKKLNRAYTLLSAFLKGQAFEGAPSLRERVLRRLSEQRVLRGVRLLGTARSVVTDRLHGHILCLLMDIPHVVLDNTYGKTSGFMSTWQTPSPRARLVDSIETGLRLLSDGGHLDPAAWQPSLAAQARPLGEGCASSA